MPENMKVKDLLLDIQTIGTVERTDDDLARDPKRKDWTWAEPTPEFQSIVGSLHIDDRVRETLESENRLKWFGRVAPMPFQFIAAPFFSAWDSLEDIYYGRRLKTTLIVNAGVLLGIGVSLGIAFVGIPVLISALGPAGVVLAGSTIAFGGAIGFAAIGAMVGNLAGKWLSQKLFSSERKMQPKKIDSARYKRIYNIDEDIYILMNAYLQNRSSIVQEPVKKRLLRNLRKDALKKGQALQHVRLGHYFCEELIVLKTMDKSELVQKNIDAIVSILTELSKEVAVIDQGTKDLIATTLFGLENPQSQQIDLALQSQLNTLTDTPSARRVLDPHIKSPDKVIQSYQTARRGDDDFGSKLNEKANKFNMELVTTTKHQHIFCDSSTKTKLPPVNLGDDLYFTDLASFRSLTTERQQKMAECFICEFKAQSRPGQVMEIVANGNAVFAEALYLAAKHSGVNAVIAVDGFKSQLDVDQIVSKVNSRLQKKTASTVARG
jgi:hypothetical protein